MFARAHGLRKKEFLNINPREFWTYIKWKLAPQKEAARQSWTTTRFLAFSFLRPYSKGLKKPEDLGAFSWEVAPGDRFTDEELQTVDWEKLDLNLKAEK